MFAALFCGKNLGITILFIGVHKVMGYKETETHPSYGMIGWSRQHGGERVLFGSELTHNETISLRIAHASTERNLNNDWYYGGDEIIEVFLSTTQFADFLTSPNLGSGVPCTLYYAEGEIKESPTFTPKVEIFKKEFQEDLSELDELLVSMVELAEQLSEAPRIKKAEIRELKNKVSRVKMELQSNMPYLYKQFVENMVKTTQVAKAEVEAYVDRRIRDSGLEAIKNEVPKLLERKEE